MIVAAWMHSKWSSVLISVRGWFFVIGTVFFSGSLYLLAVIGAKWLGAITPLGGLAFLAGWVWIARAAWTSHEGA